MAVIRWLRCVALAAAGCLVACGPADVTRPNILLITLDTTRADHCSVLGYERDTTPHLDALAAEGTRFTRAYSPTSTTAPSHATLFTSLHPVTHRVVKNGVPLADDRHTLAERLGAAGWQTAGIVSSFVLSDKFGLSQGFDHWDDKLPVAKSTFRLEQWGEHELEGGFDRRGDHTTTKAIRWLEKRRKGDRPFFLFVHYFDPHSPFLPPAEFAGRFGARPGDESLESTVALYDAEIAFTDAQIGRLLENLASLELADDTIVVVTADHGEGLMQHGHMNHGVHVYEEAVHVPLIARWPGQIAADRSVTEPVALVDLMPTLLDLAGLDDDGYELQGESLADVLAGDGALDPERPILLQRRFYDDRVIDGVRVTGEQHALRTGRWKYIEGTTDGTRELFDLQVDPTERTNLVEAHPERAATMAARLAAWLDAHRVAGDANPQLDPDDAANLEAMGYLK